MVIQNNIIPFTTKPKITDSFQINFTLPKAFNNYLKTKNQTIMIKSIQFLSICVLLFFTEKTRAQSFEETTFEDITTTPSASRSANFIDVNGDGFKRVVRRRRLWGLVYARCRADGRRPDSHVDHR